MPWIWCSACGQHEKWSKWLWNQYGEDNDDVCCADCHEDWESSDDDDLESSEDENQEPPADMSQEEQMQWMLDRSREMLDELKER